MSSLSAWLFVAVVFAVLWVFWIVCMFVISQIADGIADRLDKPKAAKRDGEAAQALKGKGS